VELALPYEYIYLMQAGYLAGFSTQNSNSKFNSIKIGNEQRHQMY
jgi:hypothetical protein